MLSRERRPKAASGVTVRMSVLFLILLGLVFAGEAPLYTVEDLKGTAAALSGDSAKRSLKVGDSLKEGDQIQLGADSSVVLSLGDNTQVELDADTRLKIDKLRPKGEEGFLSRLNLLQGTIRASIQKLSASGSTFEIFTPTAVAGVRGTQFEAFTDDGDQLTTSTFEGAVEVVAGKNKTIVEAGKSVKTVRGAFQPKTEISREQKQRFQKFVERKTQTIRARQERAKNAGAERRDNQNRDNPQGKDAHDGSRTPPPGNKPAGGGKR